MYVEYFHIATLFAGCLLDSAPRPPDVPPRNPTMNRLNGRLATAPPADPSQDFEPSCLVRTPSGNVYIPTGTLSEFPITPLISCYTFLALKLVFRN